jgi:hypothetical protein
MVPVAFQALHTMFENAMVDGLVVPTRNMTPVNAADAGKAFKLDLADLELRLEAGEHRDRGGHDLRSWYETRAIEDGADSLILRRTTHAAPKDVAGGYERFSWATICREVAKLQIGLLDGEALTLATGFATAERKTENRWRKVVTPMGLEPGNQGHCEATITATYHDFAQLPSRFVPAGRWPSPWLSSCWATAGQQNPGSVWSRWNAPASIC